MAFRIVSDMPLPKDRAAKGNDKYGLCQLEVGQALIFDADDDGFYRSATGRRVHRAVSSAFKKQKAGKGKFAVRYLPDGRCGIWRVE